MSIGVCMCAPTIVRGWVETVHNVCVCVLTGGRAWRAWGVGVQGALARFQDSLLDHTDAVTVHGLLQHVEDLLSAHTLERKDPCVERRRGMHFNTQIGVHTQAHIHSEGWKHHAHTHTHSLLHNNYLTRFT